MKPGIFADLMPCIITGQIFVFLAIKSSNTKKPQKAHSKIKITVIFHLRELYIRFVSWYRGIVLQLPWVIRR
jgi:hypothetical protein